MGFLLDKCLYDRLSTDIIDMCEPYVCSKDERIDSFFHNQHKDNYADYNNEMMGFSHCFYTDTDAPKLVCAFSLSNSALRTSPLSRTDRNRFNRDIPNSKRRSQYPAVLIGQLCVFDGFSHLNIGKELMDFIKLLAIHPDNNFAARYLVVDAINTPKVISYYTANGFQFLFPTDEEEQIALHKIKEGDVSVPDSPTRLMFFDLIVLKP